MNHDVLARERSLLSHTQMDSDSGVASAFVEFLLFAGFICFLCTGQKVSGVSFGQCLTRSIATRMGVSGDSQQGWLSLHYRQFLTLSMVHGTVVRACEFPLFCWRHVDKDCHLAWFCVVEQSCHSAFFGSFVHILHSLGPISKPLTCVLPFQFCSHPHRKGLGQFVAPTSH